MNIVDYTEKVISKKTAELQLRETKWKEKQGGYLEKWQEKILLDGVLDIKLLRSHLLFERRLLDKLIEAPISKREELIIKYGGTDKDNLLKVLCSLIDEVIDRKTTKDPWMIKIERSEFLGVLREISAKYREILRRTSPEILENTQQS